MAVADAKGRRFDAATGVVFAVLALIGLFLPGAPPVADDSIEEIQRFFVDKHDSLLVGGFITGLSMAFLLWFLGSLRSYLRAAEGGEGRLSAAAFGGGVVTAVFTLAGVATFAALTFKVAEQGDEAVTRAFFDLGNELLTVAGFGAIVLFGAASCSGARSGALPPWAYWSGTAVTAIQPIAAIGVFAESGPLAAGGPVAIIALLVGVIWIAAVSVLLYLRAGVPPRPLAEP